MIQECLKSRIDLNTTDWVEEEHISPYADPEGIVLPLGTQDDFHNFFTNYVIYTIKEKDSKQNLHNEKGILFLHIDNPRANVQDLENVIKPAHYSKIKLNNFHSVYLQVPATNSATGGQPSFLEGIFKII